MTSGIPDATVNLLNGKYVIEKYLTELPTDIKCTLTLNYTPAWDGMLFFMNFHLSYNNALYLLLILLLCQNYNIYIIIH